MSEEAYASTVEVENANAQALQGVDARGLDQALSQLGVTETAQDLHPER